MSGLADLRRHPKSLKRVQYAGGAYIETTKAAAPELLVDPEQAERRAKWDEHADRILRRGPRLFGLQR